MSTTENKASKKNWSGNDKASQTLTEHRNNMAPDKKLEGGVKGNWEAGVSWCADNRLNREMRTSALDRWKTTTSCANIKLALAFPIQPFDYPPSRNSGFEWEILLKHGLGIIWNFCYWETSSGGKAEAYTLCMYKNMATLTVILQFYFS